MTRSRLHSIIMIIGQFPLVRARKEIRWRKTCYERKLQLAGKQTWICFVYAIYHRGWLSSKTPIFPYLTAANEPGVL